jgi:hypothetical protein
MFKNNIKCAVILKIIRAFETTMYLLYLDIVGFSAGCFEKKIIREKIRHNFEK